MLLTPAQTEPESFELRRTLFFLPGVDASHVYVRAWALGCFHSLISTKTFGRALTASVDSCAEIKETVSTRVVGGGDSSVVRAPELVIERSRVRIPAGTAGEFYSPGSTFCADSYFGIRSTPVLPQ